jgi:hypothetical protein
MVNIKLVDKLYKIAMVQDNIESERDIIHAFAELIVRECAEVVYSRSGHATPQDLYEHFGVKE